MPLKIHPELDHVLEDLEPEEEKHLEQSIVAEGRVRDDIIAWQDWVVDGKHRLKIARKHNITVKVRRIPFRNLKEVIIWMRENAIGRRNMKPHVRKYQIGKLYATRKSLPGGNRRSVKGSSVAEEMARKVGVNERTVRRAGSVATAVDKLEPTVREAYFDGTLAATDDEVVAIAKMEPDEQKTVVKQVHDGKTTFKKKTGGKQKGSAKSKRKPKQPKSKSQALESADESYKKLVRVLPKDVYNQCQTHLVAIKKYIDRAKQAQR